MRSSLLGVQSWQRGAGARYKHNEQLCRFGPAELVGVLTEKHALRPELTSTRARDVLLALTGPQLFVQFTRDLGWSSEELAAWITPAVLEQMVGVSPGGALRPARAGPAVDLKPRPRAGQGEPVATT